ncbi:MAG: phage holin family protein [Sphingomicrobium sp.]
MITRDRGIADTNEPHVIHPASLRGEAAGSTGEASGDNVVDLLKQLVGHGSHLAERQLALIKAEVRESTTDLKTAAGAMAGAAVVGLAGLGVTLMGMPICSARRSTTRRRRP